MREAQVEAKASQWLQALCGSEQREEEPMSISKRKVSVLTIWLSALFAAVLAPVAAADFGIEGWDGRVESIEPGVLKAGEHPREITTTIDFHSRTHPTGLVPDGSLRNLYADLPAGLIGAPNATPRCLPEQLAPPSGPPQCPLDSIVGRVLLKIGVSFLGGAPLYARAPIFNMDPPPGFPAQLGLNVGGVPVQIVGEVRTDANSIIRLRIRNNSQGLAILGITTPFWGVPGDPSHNHERCLGSSTSPDPALGSPG